MYNREGIMLCYPATTRRVATFENPFFCQPKLRGNRAIIEWFKGKPILLSSYGNTVQGLDHITDAIEEMKLRQLQYDGELYVHGMSQEEINSICSRTKKPHKNASQMQFHIFDFKSTSKQQWERINILHTLQLLDPLFIVYTAFATKENWSDYCATFVSDIHQYEGIILRNPIGYYVEKRSAAILKFKPTYKDDYTIVAVKEAVSENGDNLGMVGSFIVKAKDRPETFTVGAGRLTHNERKEFFHADIRGRLLSVKHERITTKYGVPVCAIALKVK